MSAPRSKDGLKETERPLVIRQLESSSMIEIPVSVQGKQINAIIVTASEVTLISDRVYRALETKPGIKAEFTLRGAGREMEMIGYLLDTTSIDIDSLEFKENLYVALIEDDMLIGLDFMTKHKATLNMKENSFHIQDKVVPFEPKTEASVHAVSTVRIRTARRVSVPARSVLQLQCVPDQPLEDKPYLIQPEVRTMFACRVCIEGKQVPTMAFINLSDRKVTLFKNQRVGTAYEVDEILPEDGNKPEATFRTLQTSMNDNSEIPEHLQDLYQRSCLGLDEYQRAELKQLLISYADVFSSHEFDIGNFRAIEHAIDTGDARPIKQ
ncbi:uncharacterized protein LOC117336666 [Pecten maximus]|uniref:uncharacterized protein LOC117336666 n=1 Tax=Pecten maximus TaxID=6579 RepID=UPI00145809EA|nr:uncharacterized protein LOC117336666 [Pecten maximus]